MKKYYIKTFGCQMNKAMSERIEGDYQARGYRPAKSWKEADEIVINTCSVRQRAEDRVQGFLENARGVEAKIILTGCMNHWGKEKIFLMFPEVDEVLPISEVGFNLPAVRRDKTHAWVQISEGCNSFCSYCIVPYSRGREKSRPMTEVIDEVRDLATRGYKEITLLGQNVNSYGLENVGIGLRKSRFGEKSSLQNSLAAYRPLRGAFLSPPPNGGAAESLLAAKILQLRISPFVFLLKEISKIAGIEKIHFMTSNPWDFGDDLIEEIARNDKIDRFIHLPVQSGSNRILKLMNRGYSREDYLELVKKLRNKVKDVQIGTDIIVGFPTESEADFQETVDLAKKAGWVVGFVAQYSPRPGTVAAKMKDDVPASVKKQRWEALDEIINKKNLARRPEIR